MSERSGLLTSLAQGLIDETGGLARSLAGSLRASIQRGDVRHGEKLPASRILARELGLSRGTITAAIETLVAEGMLESRVGAGTFVAAPLANEFRPLRGRDAAFGPTIEMPPPPYIDQPRPGMADFRPCRPSLEIFPMQAWKRCVARAGSVRPASDYGEALGALALREELCDYLRRARGLQLTPDQIIVTSGAVHAMHLAASLRVRPGSQVIVEDPGYPLARATFAKAGAQIVPIEVDEEGLRVDLLPDQAEDVALVYVTPSHQFPTGSRLSLARRAALVDWAERRGVLVIEDDYDGEFRYDVPPLSPLAAIDSGSVLYVGTFSKTMFPGLRIGFAVGHRQLIEAMGRVRTIEEYAANDLNQSALLNFVRGGHYERHVARMRRCYSAKRRSLVEAVSQAGSNARIEGIQSGLNAHVILRPGLSARELSAKLEVAGMLVPSIARYSLSSASADLGLVVGYAAPSEVQIAELGRLIAISAEGK